MSEEIEIWDRVADFWNNQIGEGNDFQLQLVNPTTLKLLNLQPGERVLEIACGNGNFTRIMGRSGADVLAFDGSKVFIQHAIALTKPADGKIEYRSINVTSARDVDPLIARGPFDAIVSNMALMDFSSLEVLAHALPKLMHIKSRFVFAVSHPCFHSNLSTMTSQMTESEEGKLAQTFGVAVTRYRRSFVHKSTGIINQPEPHLMFHRPICDLLRPFFEQGLILDALEEPAYPTATGQNAFSWKKRPEIPPVLAVRLRRCT